MVILKNDVNVLMHEISDPTVNVSQNYNLVLASGSPRRRQLLTDAGYKFKVIVPDESVEKSVSHRLQPEPFVAEASLRKAQAIAVGLNEAIVIGADTVAECDGQILGKPKDREHAQIILSKLSGTIHRVLTGVTVCNCNTSQSVTHVETTTLEMTELSTHDLRIYLDSENWMGKAGAFGYQDGISWVKILRGLESNVVGLPVERIPGMIQKVTR